MVAEVQQLQQLVRLLAEVVQLEVELEAPGRVGQVREGRLAVRPEGHEAAGDGHRRPLAGGRQRGQRLGRRVRAREPVGERLHAAAAQLGQLVAPRQLHEGALRRLLAHRAVRPNRLRYASMNGSMSPSITRCTSPTLSSVRWSLTIV